MSAEKRECQAALDALIDCFVQLVEAPMEVRWLAGQLLSARIITLSQLEEAQSLLTPGTEKQRRQTLLTVLLRKVTHDIQFFDRFLDILRDDPGLTVYVNRIQKSYESHLEQQPPPATMIPVTSAQATIPDSFTTVPTQTQASSDPLFTQTQNSSGPLLAQAQASSGPLVTQTSSSPFFTPTQPGCNVLLAQNQAKSGVLPTQIQGSYGVPPTQMQASSGLVPTQMQASYSLPLSREHDIPGHSVPVPEAGAEVTMRRELGRKAKGILLSYANELPGQLKAILVPVKGMLVQEGIIENDSIDLGTLGVPAQLNADKLYNTIITSLEYNPSKFPKLVNSLKSFPTLTTVAEELEEAGKSAGLFGGDGPKHTQSSVEVTTTASSFLCSECGRGFSSQPKLSAHIQTHSSNWPYKCTHSSDQTYKCNIKSCQKVFSSAEKLSKHLECHKGAKQFSCPYENCHRIFLRQSHLKKHLKIHTRDQFTCPVADCRAKFATESEYNMHLDTHISYQHQCPHSGCQLTFPTQKRLDLHYRVSHLSNHEAGIKVASAAASSLALSPTATIPTNLFPANQLDCRSKPHQHDILNYVGATRVSLELNEVECTHSPSGYESDSGYSTYDVSPLASGMSYTDSLSPATTPVTPNPIFPPPTSSPTAPTPLNPFQEELLETSLSSASSSDRNYFGAKFSPRPGTPTDSQSEHSLTPPALFSSDYYMAPPQFHLPPTSQPQPHAFHMQYLPMFVDGVRSVTPATTNLSSIKDGKQDVLTTSSGSSSPSETQAPTSSKSQAKSSRSSSCTKLRQQRSRSVPMKSSQYNKSQWPKSMNPENLVAFRSFILNKFKKGQEHESLASSLSSTKPLMHHPMVHMPAIAQCERPHKLSFVPNKPTSLGALRGEYSDLLAEMAFNPDSLLSSESSGNSPLGVLGVSSSLEDFGLSLANEMSLSSSALHNPSNQSESPLHVSEATMDIDKCVQFFTEDPITQSLSESNLPSSFIQDLDNIFKTE